MISLSKIQLLSHTAQEKMDEFLAFMHKKLVTLQTFFQNEVIPIFNHAYEYLLLEINPFYHHLLYYLIISTLGYLSLKATNNKKSPVSQTKTRHDLDLFFTSVSAATISSMSTIEMENFSNTQLMILMVLMFSGGEVFISLLGLQLRKLKHKKRTLRNIYNTSSSLSTSVPVILVDDHQGMKYRSLRALGQVVLGYLLVSHLLGFSSVVLYISIVKSATNVLERKGIDLHLFSLFTTVSTFSNCGFIPTNENMIVLKKNSGLLLILIPQILLGNKLYPCCLRLVIWALEKLTKKEEYGHILKNNGELRYGLLTSEFPAVLSAITAVLLILVQFVVFCALQFNSVVLEGLNWYENLVGSLFQTVNSRHSGETIVDLSQISAATLVLFVVMMYLPSYTTFVPIGYDKEQPPLESRSQSSKRHSNNFAENLKFSQLSYLAIFVFVICITEWKSLEDDPLNFNVFNIAVEVVSAYGNVGFSTGYSCERRLQNRQNCKDTWYGFVGRWGREGKLVLILVMVFGKLKKFNMNAGKAWKLSF